MDEVLLLAQSADGRPALPVWRDMRSPELVHGAGWQPEWALSVVSQGREGLYRPEDRRAGYDGGISPGSGWAARRDIPACKADLPGLRKSPAARLAAMVEAVVPFAAAGAALAAAVTAGNALSAYLSFGV